MKLRPYILPIGLSVLLTGSIFAICYPQTVNIVQELVAASLPASIPDSGYHILVDGLTAGLLALPGLILVVGLDRIINRP